MGAVSFSTSLRNDRLSAIVAAINDGTGSGIMRFYTAPRPTAGASVTTQTLLGTVGFSESAATIDNGSATFALITDDNAGDASGDAVWCRVLSGDGVFVMDMDVTDNAGPGPVKMASVSIYEGGIIHVSSFVITEGNA